MMSFSAFVFVCVRACTCVCVRVCTRALNDRRFLVCSQAERVRKEEIELGWKRDLLAKGTKTVDSDQGLRCLRE